MKKSNKLEESDLQNYVFEVTAAEIYPDGVTVPDGWEIFDFGPPSAGESFIDELGRRDTAYSNWTTYPRLLIRRKKQIDWDKELEAAGATTATPKGWHPVGFRSPRKGDVYSYQGCPQEASFDYLSESYLILERCPNTFTVDGVTFENPRGYEFVRMGFLTEKEDNAGWRSAYLRKGGHVGQLWRHDALNDSHTVFRPLK